MKYISNKKKLICLTETSGMVGDTYFLNDQLACRLSNVLVDLFLSHPY